MPSGLKLDGYDLAVAGGVFLGHFHDPRAHRAHLGTVGAAEDRGHDVAAEGGAGHRQELLVRLDVQAGAVGGQAGLQLGGDHAGQVPAERRRAYQDNLRPDLLAQVNEGAAIDPGKVRAQQRIVHDVDGVAAVGDGLFGDTADTGAEQEPEHPVWSFAASSRALPASSQETSETAPRWTSMNTATP